MMTLKTLVPVLLACLAALAGCAAGRSSPDVFRAVPGQPGEPFRPAPPPEDVPVPPGDQWPATTVPAQPLTPDDCVAFALAHRPETAASWRELRAAAARAAAEEAAARARLDLSATATRSRTPAFPGGGAAGTRSRVGATLGLRWLLSDPGRAARVDGAAAAVITAGFRHNALLDDVVFEVLAAGNRLQAAAVAVDEAAAAREQSRRHLRLARARRAAGTVDGAVLRRAETDLAAAEREVTRAENARRAARERLLEAMGLPADTDLSLAAFDAGAGPAFAAADIPSLLAEATRRRPALQAALGRWHEREAAVRAAEARGKPTLGLGGMFGLLGERLLPGRLQWQTGLDFNLPLLDGGESAYRLEAAREELAGESARLQATLQGIEREAWSAWRTYEDAGQALAVAALLLDQAREDVRVTAARHRHGAAGGHELSLARGEGERAACRHDRARLDYQLAALRLEHALGRLGGGEDHLSDE